MWNWTQSSEIQSLACLHAEPEGHWCLPCRKASGNALCPGSKPSALAGSHTLRQVRISRLRSGGPHVLLQAQSGAGGHGVMFTLSRPHVLGIFELLLLVVVPLRQNVKQ